MIDVTGGEIHIRLTPPFEVWMTKEAYEVLKRDAQRYQALRADVKEFGYIDDSWDLNGTPEAFDDYADEIRSRRGIE